MLTILVTVIVVGLGLLALLWMGTMWAQGYFYDSPTDGLSWRAPAAAGALSAFVLLWMVIEYRRPNNTDTLFRFSTERSQQFDHFISVRRGEEGDQEILYKRISAGGGRSEFRDNKGQTWARSKSGMMVALIIEEKVQEGGEEKVVRRRFNAELSPDGKTFAPKASRGIQQSLRYLEEGGDRFIVEDQLGKAISYRRGLLFYNIVLNGIHFVLWFVVLWLLLQFQWPHALLGAAACWLAMTLALLPYALGRSRDAAEKRAQLRPTAMLVVRETLT